MTLRNGCLKLSVAAAAVMCISATAGAADLPPDPDIFNWTGFYLGGHAGGVVEGNARMRFPGGTLNADLDGFLGGGHVGYNYQINNFVIGGEADLSFGEVDGAAGPVTDFDADLFASFRFRAGYAVNNLLPFLTVGVGIADAEQRIPALGTPNNVHVGVVAGGGLEWAFTQNISARVEYLYSYYGRETYAYPPGSTRTDFDTHMIRGGISWHFGALGPQPIPPP